MAISGGEAVELEPMSAGPTIDFGDEIGVAETIYTLHSEVLTFGESFGASEVTFALSLSPEVLSLVQELAEADEERVADAVRSSVPPSPNTVSAHVVEAAGGERMIRARSFTPPQREWGVGGGILSTGSVAAAAVRLLARDRIAARGALPPERCIEPEEMFAELGTRGIRFEFSEEPAPEGASR
jgi:hypothetical protein